MKDMKYRSRTEIVDMILQSTRTGATKTRIMYKAYLSYTQVKEYLAFMQESGLLKYEDGSQLYRITEKGLHFIHVYSEISDLVTPKPSDRKSF